jgi:hypothetical protein
LPKIGDGDVVTTSSNNNNNNNQKITYVDENSESGTEDCESGGDNDD